MISVIARIMILNSDPLHDPRIANQFGKLFAKVRPMQAGGDQNGDAVECNPRGDQRFDYRPQEEMVGHRSGNVANEYAGAFASTGEFSQRR